MGDVNEESGAQVGAGVGGDGGGGDDGSGGGGGVGGGGGGGGSSVTPAVQRSGRYGRLGGGSIGSLAGSLTRGCVGGEKRSSHEFSV